MDPTNLLSGLKTDVWYEALIRVSALGCLVGLIWTVKGITNAQLELVSFGMLLFGIGELKNRKPWSYIKPSNAYTGPAALVSGQVRDPDLVGCGLQVGGGVLFLLGIISVIRAAV
jgi:hypothetical protein